MYTKVRLFIFSNQNIKSGFLVTKLMLYNFQCVLLLFTIIKTFSLQSTANKTAPLWTSKMLYITT